MHLPSKPTSYDWCADNFNFNFNFVCVFLSNQLLEGSIWNYSLCIFFLQKAQFNIVYYISIYVFVHIAVKDCAILIIIRGCPSIYWIFQLILIAWRYFSEKISYAKLNYHFQTVIWIDLGELHIFLPNDDCCYIVWWIFCMLCVRCWCCSCGCCLYCGDCHLFFYQKVHGAMQAHYCHISIGLVYYCTFFFLHSIDINQQVHCKTCNVYSFTLYEQIVGYKYMRKSREKKTPHAQSDQLTKNRDAYKKKRKKSLYTFSHMHIRTSNKQAVTERKTSFCAHKILLCDLLQMCFHSMIFFPSFH